MRFSTSGFFMNQCPPGPQVFHWGCFEFFRKIFANECLSPVSTTLAISCLTVSMTPAFNSCHRFSVSAIVVDTGDKFITGVNDTGDKFIASDNDTGEQLSPVSLTPMNCLS
jgi:hypothetical protein